jgi:lipopolysaccharide biosynthesis glycosyltransferase
VGFNSGLLVINTKTITNSLFNDLNKLIIKYTPDALCSDQALLNLYFYKKWKKLPRSYNMLINIAYINYCLKANEVKGAIIHFAVSPKPWEKGNKFYAEWKNNLALAEKMDLKNIRAPSRIWSNKELIVYDAYLKIRWIIVKTYSYVPIPIRNQIDKLKEVPPRIAYKIGRVIKKVSPKLYYKLGCKN